MEEEGMLLLQAFTTIWHNDIKVVWKENWYDKEGELFRQENRFDRIKDILYKIRQKVL